MTCPPAWVRELTEEVLGGPPVAIGQYRIIDGQPVKITAGQYWGTYGLSNFWHWRSVLPNGALGTEHHGYGNDNWPHCTREEAIAVARTSPRPSNSQPPHTNTPA